MPKCSSLLLLKPKDCTGLWTEAKELQSQEAFPNNTSWQLSFIQTNSELSLSELKCWRAIQKKDRFLK